MTGLTDPRWAPAGNWLPAALASLPVALNIPGMRIAFLLICCIAMGCARTPKPTPPLWEQISEAHDSEAFRKHTALSGDIHIDFVGRPAFDARFIYEIKTGRTRMQLADDTILVFDGHDAWVAPASSTFTDARFALRTWTHFIMLPFKLDDKSIRWEPTETRALAGRQYDSARISFPSGSVDAPDDWYILYADKVTHRLNGVAYIVSYGRSVQEAADHPQAITFYDFKNTDGSEIPLAWRFWQWNKEEGIFGQPLGSARIYNLDFMTPKTNAFARPNDSRLDPIKTPIRP